MPKKFEKELERQFGAYLKVAIVNARKEYLTDFKRIIQHEISLDEIERIEDEYEKSVLNAALDLKSMEDCSSIDIEKVLEDIENPFLYNAVSSLKKHQIKVLAYRFGYEKTFDEIGELMGITDRQAKDLYFNTISKLRKIMGEK